MKKLLAEISSALLTIPITALRDVVIAESAERFEIRIRRKIAKEIRAELGRWHSASHPDSVVEECARIALGEKGKA